MDQEFSSQDRTTTIDKRPKLESTICVDAATDHKHGDGLELITPLTGSGPHLLSQSLVDANSGKRSLQPAIGLPALQQPHAVEYSRCCPVDVAERSPELPCGNGPDRLRHLASARADHAIPLTGYNRTSTSFHGRLNYPAVPIDPIKTSCLVTQQLRRSSFDHATRLLPPPHSRPTLRTTDLARPSYFNIILCKGEDATRD